ncbi:putative bifunctional transcriptional activator/DNA repair enzyme AlkA [Burkholderiales bacterium]|nr:putative bifunctional transcriptional activator/DNA repair enzyme AlkA [Burkholderiales bacterium]
MAGMDTEDNLYAALLARDARFDGRFFVGVTSTGIYCRPVCRVRAPRRANCRFFGHAAAAEAAGFRPCRRCRPELAPPQAALASGAGLATAAAARIEAGCIEAGGLSALAVRLGVSERHFRRVFREQFGVTPVAYVQTQRLLLVKRLLTDTDLPITEVALAAGFGSLRRCNELFRAHYGLAPGAWRKGSGEDGGASLAGAADAGFRFTLAYRPPFDWPRLAAFLGARAIPGVEMVNGACYRRSVSIEQGTQTRAGWLEVSAAPERSEVHARVSRELVPALPGVLAGVRRLCDLACEPAAVNEVLGDLAADAPGLRIPGAFDAFEMSVRAVLGQQITVRAAHTLAGRLVARWGVACATPWPEVNRLFPTARQFASLTVDDLGALGIVAQRARAILALASAVAAGEIDLQPGADLGVTMAALQDLPGIGPWTAQYIALRALAWPDAWPKGDIALRKALGVRTDREAQTMAEAWRPWRGYATMHLWRRLSETNRPST